MTWISIALGVLRLSAINPMFLVPSRAAKNGNGLTDDAYPRTADATPNHSGNARKTARQILDFSSGELISTMFGIDCP